MRSQIKALLIEDSDEDRLAFRRNIKRLNQQSQLIEIEYAEAASLEEGLSVFRRESLDIDIVLLDLSLPDSEGLNTLNSFLNTVDSHFPIIVLTGDGSEAHALTAIQKGAQDYLLKSEISPFTLTRSISYALERSRMALELEELRVQQAQSLKMATLGEMAGGIAHEINNPLAIILGYANRLQSGKLSSADSDEIVEMGRKLSFVTNRIVKIVKGLVSYSREDDRNPMANVSLDKIMDETMSLCAERFNASDIELQVGEILNIDVYCNSVQISQVLINLLNNAHFAVLNLDEKWVKVHTRRADAFLEILISDSGQTPNEEVQRKIFQPFYTTKEMGSGTGLGMSISKNIIETHEGSLDILPEERHTTFRVRLPISMTVQEVRS